MGKLYAKSAYKSRVVRFNFRNEYQYRKDHVHIQNVLWLCQELYQSIGLIAIYQKNNDDPSDFKDDADNDYEDATRIPEHLNDDVCKGVLVAFHLVCLLARLHLLVTEKRQKMCISIASRLE